MSATLRLHFDSENVDLDGTLFSKNKEFDSLGTIPGLAAFKSGKVTKPPEPKDKDFYDEEEPDAY